MGYHQYGDIPDETQLKIVALRNKMFDLCDRDMTLIVRECDYSDDLLHEICNSEMIKHDGR